MRRVVVNRAYSLIARLSLGIAMLALWTGVWVQQADAQDLKSAKAAIESRNYDKAITELRAFLEQKPKEKEGHYLLGLALKGKGRIDEAMAEFEIAVDRDKKYTDALYELGMLQTDKGLYAEAEQTLAEGEKYSKGKESRFFYAQGMLKAAQDDLGGATQLMTKAIAMAPNDPLYHQGLGDIYMKRKVWGLAITEYNKALSLDPDSPDAALTHYRLGKLHFESQQFQQAVEEFKKATALDPNIADAWYQQGYIYYLAKQPAVAVASLEKSVALQPDHFESNYYLAKSLNETQRLRAAVPYYEKALQLNPEASDCYAGLADGYLAEAGALGNGASPPDSVQKRVLYNKAVVAYEKAVMLAPDDPDLVYSLGWVQSQEQVGQYDKAIANLQRAIELDPSSEKPHIQLALIYFGRENFSEAIPHLKKAIEINPEDQNPYAYLGRAYIQQGLYDEAITQVSQMLDPVIARQEDPSRLSNVYFTLGQELYKMEKYPQAVQMFRRKTVVDSTSYATYLNMGLAALVGKDFKIAEEAFLRAVALKQDDSDSLSMLQAKRFLGVTYLQMENNAGAKKVYQEILEMDPKNDDALYRMGVFALIDKQYNPAERYLRQAIAIKPDNAAYHLALAQTYTNSQRLNEAVKEYRETLKLDPNNTTAQQQLQTVLEALAARN